MSKEQPDHLHLQDHKEDNKNLDIGSEEPDPPLPLTASSRALYMLGDITASPGYKFSQWLELVRRRSSLYHCSRFPNHRSYNFVHLSSSRNGLLIADPRDTAETSLWERLGKAAPLDIESSSFSWSMLSSLHHTQHDISNENPDDDVNKALEVKVNSGGVVLFALFNLPGSGDLLPREAVAVIKIASSRMVTQSERLGYEFAKWLGVQTPQYTTPKRGRLLLRLNFELLNLNKGPTMHLYWVPYSNAMVENSTSSEDSLCLPFPEEDMIEARVVHNSNSEWLQIKEATEKARETAVSEGDEVGEMTCTELLEALELSRCLLLMSYVHGSPLLESSAAFESREATEKTAAALGRILVLDLIIRNEDRLPCRQLRWRGNHANLLLADKMIPIGADTLKEAVDSAIQRFRPRAMRAFEQEMKATSLGNRLSCDNAELGSESSNLSDIIELPRSTVPSPKSETSEDLPGFDLRIVAIDTVVPRRPPAGKRTNDQSNYPKLVELLLNNYDYSAHLLHEITGGKMGYSKDEKDETVADIRVAEVAFAAQAFRNGFRAGLRDLQGFCIFLLKLHQKLDSLLRLFLNIIDKTSVEFDRDDLVPDSPRHAISFSRTHSYNYSDFSDPDMQNTPSKPSSGNKDISDTGNCLLTRENWHGKLKGSGDQIHNLRLTAKLRDFHKFAKVDAESSRELEQWNEMLKNEAVKLCQENNFNTGFFEGSENNSVIDAYELKVRLDHILERIALISEAANTERPSSITNSLYIGGALAARSAFTLQYLGITHILCLCFNDIGQSDSQHPSLFEYRNFSISDEEDSNIDIIFDEACDFIDQVEKNGGKVLVHCFEGKSRSATLVLAYLMLRKNMTLLKAWNTLKKVHRRAQPNDGFAKILLDLDKKLHGKVSIEWQQKKPMMQICSICGKNVGLSSSSLKLHLQKTHKKLSSGSVDSAMSMEIEKVLDSLKVSRVGSVSPTQTQSHLMMDE